jgi:hypothetical protein
MEIAKKSGSRLGRDLSYQNEEDIHYIALPLNNLCHTGFLFVMSSLWEMYCIVFIRVLVYP